MSAKKKFDTEPFVMTALWLLDKDCPFSPTTRCVYLVLRKHLPYGKADGVVFPAVKTIAAEAGVSVRRARDSLNELQDAGLITIRKRAEDPHRNEYVIHALSQAQIDTLCRPRPEPADPVCPAETMRHDLPAQEIEAAESAQEVEQEKENQGTRPNGLAGHTYGVCPADAGPPAELGSQRLGQVGTTAAPLATAGSTAGPGSTDGPPLATDGPGSTPGLAKTPGSAGQTAGSGDGQSNDSGTANSKTHWASRERTESKGQRYKRALDDLEMEAKVVMGADFAITVLPLKKPVSREATLMTMRFLLGHDGKDHDEVMAVIRHAGASPDRWKVPTLQQLREKYYDDILADLRASKPIDPELGAKIRAYQDNRPWQDTGGPGADDPDKVDHPDSETGKPIAEYVKPTDLGNDAGAVTNAITFPRLRARLERHGDPPAPDHPAKLAEEALQAEWAEREAERKRAGQERLKARATEIRGMFAERGAATSTQFTWSPALSSEGSLSATMIPVVRPA